MQMFLHIPSDSHTLTLLVLHSFCYSFRVFLPFQATAAAERRAKEAEDKAPIAPRASGAGIRHLESRLEALFMLAQKDHIYKIYLHTSFPLLKLLNPSFI